MAAVDACAVLVSLAHVPAGFRNGTKLEVIPTDRARHRASGQDAEPMRRVVMHSGSDQFLNVAVQVERDLLRGKHRQWEHGRLSTGNCNRGVRGYKLLHSKRLREEEKSAERYMNAISADSEHVYARMQE